MFFLETERKLNQFFYKCSEIFYSRKLWTINNTINFNQEDFEFYQEHYSVGGAPRLGFVAEDIFEQVLKSIDIEYIKAKEYDPYDFLVKIDGVVGAIDLKHSLNRFYQLLDPKLYSRFVVFLATKIELVSDEVIQMEIRRPQIVYTKEQHRFMQEVCI
jgi:hypothetical protein